MASSPSDIEIAIKPLEKEAQRLRSPSTLCQIASKMDESQETTATSSLSGQSLHDLHTQNHNPSVEKPQSDVEKASSKSVQSSPDWDGPEDPDNPLNWPSWKRHFHIVPPAAISFTATFGSSIITPAISAISQQFNVSTTVALLPLTLYVLALGFGPVIAAPLSETYGRHKVYLYSAPIAALFTVGAGFSQNIWTLCILRFFSGMAFSPALAIGSGSIADINRPEKRATHSAVYILMPFLGPAVGPVIGGFVTVRKSWRWTQWTIVFFAIFSMILTLFAQETHKPTILRRRNKKRGLPPPPTPFQSASQKFKVLITITLLRPIHMLLTEPIVAFFSLYVAFNFSVLFSFFAAFPFVFETVYHFTIEQSGLVFIAIGIGCVIAFVTVMACDKYLYQPRYQEAKRLQDEGKGSGAVPPEYRLYPALMGSFGLPLGLFWFAWTAKADISWASPVVAAIPFAWGNLSIFIASATYLIDTYQAQNGASAIAANGLLRYSLGGVFPLFTLQMYHTLGIGWATSLLAFIAVALLPVPWVLWKFGKAIRGRSSYPTLKV